MADIVMIRAHRHEHVERFAGAATIPVINGLTDRSHPCQVMADLMTFEEYRGSCRGRTFAWLGNCSNVCTSFIDAAPKFGFHLKIAAPAAYAPVPGDLARARAAGATIDLLSDPLEAVSKANCVVTDAWASMGDTDCEARLRAMAPYQVTPEILAQAAPGALFMHCLPAHRGQEVVDEVIDGPQSVVWDEAENRLHVQKAILLWCLESSQSHRAETSRNKATFVRGEMEQVTAWGCEPRP
jgi:ornithine carbamoyltransferase